MIRLRLTGARPAAPIGCLLLAGLTLAACAAQPPATRASAAQQAACKQRADEVYLRQNRADIYRADNFATSTRGAPYSNLPTSNATSGLSGRYARDTMLSDCLNGIGSGTPGSGPETPAAAQPAGGPVLKAAPAGAVSASPLAPRAATPEAVTSPPPGSNLVAPPADLAAPPGTRP
jgi:hypothetical protein